MNNSTNEISDRDVINAMSRYGGSFVKALAQAALRADFDNLLTIKESWPNYWQEYTKFAELSKRNQEKS